VQSSRTRNTIFTTLTFDRSQDIRNTWLLCNIASNRFLQRVRRTIDSCEYLKVYEIHKDAYPHIHILFIFSNLNYPDDHTRWLPDNVHSKLKSAWTHGLSDHQSPIAYSDYSALKYVLKYVSKSSSASHLWKRLLSPDTSYVPPTNDLGYPLKTLRYAQYKTFLMPVSVSLDRTVCKTKKIKLITWSRNFVKSYLSTLQNNEPCLSAP